MKKCIKSIVIIFIEICTMKLKKIYLVLMLLFMANIIFAMDTENVSEKYENINSVESFPILSLQDNFFFYNWYDINTSQKLKEKDVHKILLTDSFSAKYEKRAVGLNIASCVSVITGIAAIVCGAIIPNDRNEKQVFLAGGGCLALCGVGFGAAAFTYRFNAVNNYNLHKQGYE